MSMIMTIKLPQNPFSMGMIWMMKTSHTKILLVKSQNPHRSTQSKPALFPSNSIPSPKSPTSLGKLQQSSYVDPCSTSLKPPTSSSKPLKSTFLNPSSTSGKPPTSSSNLLHSTSANTSSSSLKPPTSPLPTFTIPEDIKGLIKNDIVPKVLNQPLSPMTYKDYFAALLYAEEFYLEKWSDYHLENVVLELREEEIYNHKTQERERKTFVAFAIDSVPERRPFLLSRDLVYVRPSDRDT